MDKPGYFVERSNCQSLANRQPVVLYEPKNVQIRKILMTRNFISPCAQTRVSFKALALY